MQMQKWEYAYITWQTGQWEVENSLALIHLDPDGPKADAVEKRLFKSVDWTEHFHSWVTQLGLDGFEMLGTTAVQTGQHVIRTYWFKRPLSFVSAT